MSTASMIECVLPYPPSINRHWRKYRGRVVTSKASRDYKQVAQLVLLDAMNRSASWNERYVGSIGVSITVHPPDKRRRDIDNLLKVVCDSLTGVVVEDDSQITTIKVYRGSPKVGGEIELQIWRI